jgi:hypothetical protein
MDWSEAEFTAQLGGLLDQLSKDHPGDNLGHRGRLIRAVKL